MGKTIKVCVFHSRISEQIATAIRQKFPNIDVFPVSDTSQDPPGSEKFDILIAANQLLPGMFQRMPQLKWVQLTSAGHEHVPIGGKHEHLQITHAGSIPARAVSEYVLGWMLSLSKCIPQYMDQQRKHLWSLLPTEGLAGKTLVLVGHGNIGKQVVRKAQAFDLDIIVISKNGYPIEGIKSSWKTERLSEAASRADFLVVAVPENPTTLGLISQKVLGNLRPHSIVINVARSRILDEVALIEGLKNRKFRSVVLDTFQQEPLPADSKLWDQSGLYITPHCAFYSKEHETSITALVIENLRRFQNNEVLINQI